MGCSRRPTHFSRRVGQEEVPGVVAVLSECMGGCREVIRDIESCSYITVHFCAKLDKNKSSVEKKKKRLMKICPVDGVAVFMK